jgi:hypothetical protein
MFLLAILGASPLRAAPVTYAFDTVTAVEMSGTHPSVTGLAKDTLANLTVGFVDNTNISFRYVVSRCLPLFVTAMEKPGRYLLYVTVDAAEINVQLKSCRLEIKN